VRFGSVNAPDFTVEDDSDIVVTAPPASTTGPVEITVTTPSGTSTPNPGDVFTYVGGPSLMSESGSVNVNDPSLYPVYLFGYGFTDATSVTFGSTQVTDPSSIDAYDDQDMWVTPPALGVGSVPVSVNTPAGSSVPDSPTVPVTYDSVPQVDGLSNNSNNTITGQPEGPLTGGDSFEINGSGLADATQVLFGGIPATNVSVGNDDYIYGTVPPGAQAGPVDVTVATPNGTSAVNPNDVWFYEPGGTIGAGGAGTTGLPLITAITSSTGGLVPVAGDPYFSYPSGPDASSQTVALTGVNFSGVTSVDFGTIAATFTSPVSNGDGTSIITSTVPPGISGTVPIYVTSAAGTSVVTPGAGYTVTTSPLVDGVVVDGGTQYTISGSGLYGATSVDFNGQPGTNMVVQSDGSITVDAPSGATPGDVTVTTGDGTSPVNPGDVYGFYVAPEPVFSYFGASFLGTGAPAGGDSVFACLYAGPFTPVALDFANVQAAGFSDSGSSGSGGCVSATVPSDPADVPGPVPVTINASSPGGQLSSPMLPGDYWYYGPSGAGQVPVVTGTSSGTVIIGPDYYPGIGLYGSGFSNATQVNIGGLALTSDAFTVYNDDAMDLALPPNTPTGNDHITVTTPVGTSVASTDDLLVVTPEVVPVVTAPPAPPTATSSDSSTSTSSTGTASATTGPVSATATGVGGVTVSTYGSDPESSAPSGATGTYVDVEVSSGETFTSLGIRVCGLTALANSLEYYDGSGWVAMAPQSYDPSTGCTTVTLNDSNSTPLISALTGTPIAVTAAGTGVTTTTTPPATTVTTTSTGSEPGGIVVPPASVFVPSPTTTTTVPATPPPPPPFPGAAATYPDGAIVAFVHKDFVFAGGRAFALTAKELTALRKVDHAKVVVAERGATAPTSKAPRSGTLLSTRPLNGKTAVYVVGTDSRLHGFATPRQLLVDGYDPALVVTVPNLGGLKVGKTVGMEGTAADALQTRADGAIVQASGAVYVFAGGLPFPVANLKALAGVRKVDKAIILKGKLPSTKETTIASGVLLSLSGAVFVSSGGELFPFRSMAQLVADGYGGTAALPSPGLGHVSVLTSYSAT
jgi:hypothetical protein